MELAEAERHQACVGRSVVIDATVSQYFCFFYTNTRQTVYFLCFPFQGTGRWELGHEAIQTAAKAQRQDSCRRHVASCESRASVALELWPAFGQSRVVTHIDW